MAKNAKYALYTRLFLNSEDHGGTAFIEAIIPNVETHGDSKHVDAELKIADCSRVVSLDFSVWGKDQVDDARQKIARIRRAVVAFEKVLCAQLDEIDT